MKLFYTIILCLILFSCGKTKETTSESDAASDSTNSSTRKLETFLVSEQTDTSKFEVINYDCAVIIPVAEDVVEQMKKSGSSDDEIATTLDDANFYSFNASEMIDSAGVKNVMPKKQFIKFVGSKESWTVDTYNKDLAGWNTILFKTNKSPQVTPNINVTLDLAKNYFDKK